MLEKKVSPDKADTARRMLIGVKVAQQRQKITSPRHNAQKR